jgi:ribosomal protein S1
MNDDNNFTENRYELPSYFAYYVEEGNDNNDHGQIIGTAYPTKDGELSLQLNVRPFTGNIILRTRASLERKRLDQQKKLLQDMNYTS